MFYGQFKFIFRIISIKNKNAFQLLCFMFEAANTNVILPMYFSKIKLKKHGTYP